MIVNSRHPWWLGPEILGKKVTLKTGPGGLFAIGVIEGYCDAPMIRIRTGDGQHIWWRADLSELAEEAAKT